MTILADADSPALATTATPAASISMTGETRSRIAPAIATSLMRLTKPLMPVNGSTIRPTTGTPPMSSSRPWITLTPKMSGTKWIEAVVFCRDSSSRRMRGCEVSGRVMKTSRTPWRSMYSGRACSVPSSVASAGRLTRSAERSSKKPRRSCPKDWRARSICATRRPIRPAPMTTAGRRDSGSEAW